MKSEPNVRLCMMDNQKEKRTTPPFLHYIVFLEVYCAATICIVSFLGISMGHSTEHLLLLTLVQIAITLPAIVNMYKKYSLLLPVYAILQGMTGICEFLYIFGTHNSAHGIEKSVCLGIMAVIQILACLIAVICPNKVFCRRKKSGTSDAGVTSQDPKHFPGSSYGMPQSTPKEPIDPNLANPPNSSPAAITSTKKKEKQKKQKRNVHFNVDDSSRTREKKSRFHQSLDSLKSTVDEKSKRKKAAMRKMKNLKKQRSVDQIADVTEQQDPHVIVPQQPSDAVIKAAAIHENSNKSSSYGSSSVSAPECQRSEANLQQYGVEAGHTPVTRSKPEHVGPKFRRDGEVTVSPSTVSISST